MNDTQLEVQLELVCEETKTTKLEKLTLQPDTHTFLDVKRAIEKTFSIPVCVQSLLHQSNQVADTDTLLDCYVRDGDTLQVTYPMEGECERVIEVVEWLKKLESALALTRQSSFTAYSELLSNEDYIDITNDVSHYLLYPWRDRTKYVNKLHFKSLGGLDIMMSIYKCLVDARTHHQQLLRAKFLESKCALFVVNFLDSTYALRRRFFELGGLDLCVSSFLCTESMDCDESRMRVEASFNALCK